MYKDAFSLSFTTSLEISIVEVIATSELVFAILSLSKLPVKTSPLNIWFFSKSLKISDERSITWSGSFASFATYIP